MTEKLVHCVHPKHQGDNLVPKSSIKCQTWSMPDGVCIDCCTDDQPPDSIKTVGTWTFSNIRRNCEGCPARGY